MVVQAGEEAEGHRHLSPLQMTSRDTQSPQPIPLAQQCTDCQGKEMRDTHGQICHGQSAQRPTLQPRAQPRLLRLLEAHSSPAEAVSPREGQACGGHSRAPAVDVMPACGPVVVSVWSASAHGMCMATPVLEQDTDADL